LSRRVELHCHSVFSDGVLTPDALVARAKANGVDTLVLTDHDSVSGGPDLFAAGRAHGLDVRLGIEINCAGEGAADRIHILGYGVRPDSPGFLARLGEFRERRTVRAKLMVDKLRALGHMISYEDVAAAAHETVGRPHVADALKRAGVVKSRKEAFDRFLAKDKPGFVVSMGPSPAEAIALIRDAGGTACLAHPQTAGKEPELEGLRAIGLQGVEVYYGGHTPSQVRAYGDWASSAHLLTVGGTDFHGPGTGREARLGVEYDDAGWAALEETL
jgi:predicted metal-dependent phosphoesterase TrpH